MIYTDPTGHYNNNYDHGGSGGFLIRFRSNFKTSPEKLPEKIKTPSTPVRINLTQSELDSLRAETQSLRSRSASQGASELNQPGTKYYNPNYVSNMSSTDMVLGAKNAPKGLSTMGSATRADALEAGKAWVGPGAKPITNGNGEIIGYSSDDGLRAFRLQYKPNEGRVRANFTENTRNERTNGTKELRNVHVDILGE